MDLPTTGPHVIRQGPPPVALNALSVPGIRPRTGAASGDAGRMQACSMSGLQLAFKRTEEYLFYQYSPELLIHEMNPACLFGLAWDNSCWISLWQDLALLFHRNQLRTRIHWVEAISPSDSHVYLLRKIEELVIPQSFGQQLLHSKSKTSTTRLR